MEQPGRQGLIVKGRGKAEHIGVADQLGAHAGAKGIAVDPDDAGQCPAVRIKGRGAIVGLHLEDHVPVGIEADHPGIVLEHRQAPVVLTHVLADLFGNIADIGVKQADDAGGGTGFRILIGDVAVEDLVLAVLGPGLGQDLQFHVGDLFAQAPGGPLGLYPGPGQVVANELHFLQGQGEHPVLADPDQLLIGDIQVDLHYLDPVFPNHLGGKGLDSAGLDKTRPVHHREALDQLVGQELAGNGLGFVLIKVPGEEKLGRGVDRLVPGQLTAEEQAQGLGRGAALVVGDPGPEAHLDQPVEFELVLQGQGTQRIVLGYWVGKGAGCGLLQLFRGDVRLHRKGLDGSHGVNGEVEVRGNPFSGLFSERIIECRLQADLDSGKHSVLLDLCKKRRIWSMI